jgi:hypothetical protein
MMHLRIMIGVRGERYSDDDYENADVVLARDGDKHYCLKHRYTEPRLLTSAQCKKVMEILEGRT